MPYLLYLLWAFETKVSLYYSLTIHYLNELTEMLYTKWAGKDFSEKTQYKKHKIHR